MSYPEGRLRMLEQIDKQFKNKVASTTRETNEKKQKVTSVPFNKSLKTDETRRQRRDQEANWASNKNISTSRHISRSLYVKETSDRDHKFQSEGHLDESDRSRSRNLNKSSRKSSLWEPNRNRNRNQRFRTLQEYEYRGRSSSSGHTESREGSRSPSHSKARGRGSSRSPGHSESSKRSRSPGHSESRSSSQLPGQSKSRSSSRSSGHQEISERSWPSRNRTSREDSRSVYQREFGERLRSHEKEKRSKNRLHKTEEGPSSNVCRSRSRSPESRYKPMKGRTIFTAKKFVERRPPKFSLKDILGNNSEERTTAADQMSESINRSGVSANLVSPENQPCKSSAFDFQFPGDIDAWIDEFNSQDDGSLLALLNCEKEGNCSKIGYHSNNSVNSNSDDSYADDHGKGHNRNVKITKIKCNNSNHSNNSLESESHYKNHEDGNESNGSHGNNNNDSETEDEDAQFYYENMLNHRTDNKKDSQMVWPDGSLVWARLSKTRWWPAILITGPLAGQKPARGGWTWLMWFGDHKISKIRLSQIVSFASHFRQHCRGKLTSALELAIVECLKVCADRAGVPLDGYDIKRWGLLEMGFLDLVSSYEENKDPFEPQRNSEFPASIQKELRKLQDQAEDSDFSSSTEELPPLHNAENVGDNNNGVDFCLSCAKHNKTLAYHHPLFEGYVCSQCKDALLEGLLAYDNDGCNLFCVVCGEGGELYVCESNNCGRSFCVRCMKHYLGSDSLKQVRSRSPWLCFLCTKYSQDTHGILLPREDHQDELVKLFNPISVQRTRCDPAYFTGRKLRVLSLFDGIGCARLALEQLGLDVEVYFASENDANAQHVCMFNQGFSIIHVGDLDNISSNKLQEMCPIDLVLASPPSEDLDVTNREYEGFNGTGMYILKVMKILKNLEILCQGHYTVYWLLQCTAAMKSEYKHVVSNLFEVCCLGRMKKEISLTLGKMHKINLMEPCMWDAQYFSPYVLPRLYWGNIPGLYSALEYYKEHKGDPNTLESCLTQNVHRTARVLKLRNCAIDTNITSPGVTGEPAESDQLDKDIGNWEPRIVEPKMNANSTIFTLPVLMDDKETNIWVGEVERVLGLPAHYTDVSRLNIQQRQKLLKTAPSVHVLKHLLLPLTELFLTKS